MPDGNVPSLTPVQPLPKPMTSDVDGSLDDNKALFKQKKQGEGNEARRMERLEADRTSGEIFRISEEYRNKRKDLNEQEEALQKDAPHNREQLAHIRMMRKRYQEEEGQLILNVHEPIPKAEYGAWYDAMKVRTDEERREELLQTEAPKSDTNTQKPSSVKLEQTVSEVAAAREEALRKQDLVIEQRRSEEIQRMERVEADRTSGEIFRISEEYKKKRQDLNEQEEALQKNTPNNKEDLAHVRMMRKRYQAEEGELILNVHEPISQAKYRAWHKGMVDRTDEERQKELLQTEAPKSDTNTQKPSPIKLEQTVDKAIEATITEAREEARQKRGKPLEVVGETPPPPLDEPPAPIPAPKRVPRARVLSAVEKAVQDASTEQTKEENVQEEIPKNTHILEKIQAQAVAAAIKETIVPEAQEQKVRKPLEIQSFAQAETTTTTEAKTTVTETETQTITEARQELKATYTIRKENAAIGKLYQTRMRARAWEVLKTTHVETYERLQTLQTQTTVEIDPTPALSPAELDSVQLKVVVDVRAGLPFATDERISAAVLALSTQTLADTQKSGAALAAAAALLGLSTLQTERSAEQQARVAGALGVLLEGARQAHATLSQGEKASHARAKTLQASTTSSSQGRTNDAEHGELIHEQQRFGADRQHLQARVQAQTSQLNNAAALGSALTNHTQGGAGAITVMMGMLIPTVARVGEQTPSFSGSEPTPPHFSSGGGVQGEVSHNEEQSREDYEKQTAARLHSAQAHGRMQALGGGSSSGETHRTEEGTSGRETTSTDGTEEPPLLALSQKPRTPNEAFAQTQREMLSRQSRLLGLGTGSAGGYEMMFSEGTPQTSQAMSIEERSWADTDEARAQEMMMRQQEAMQQASMEEQQQEEEQEDAPQENGEEGSPNRGKNNGSGQQLKNEVKKKVSNQAGKIFRKVITGSSPLDLTCVMILLVTVWLNVRLFAPKEGSFIREPLGDLGMFGTIIWDILVIFLILLLLIGILLLILIAAAPYLLAMGAAYSILRVFVPS